MRNRKRCPVAAPYYANGQLPPEALELVQDGLSLPHAAARQWRELVAGVQAGEGVTLTITYNSSWPTPPPHIGGLGAYRTYACQQWMWDNKGSNQCASPGYSVHGTEPGCVDIYNWAVLGKSVVDSYARAYGWIPDTVGGEPWHFKYDGVTNTESGADDLMGKAQYFQALDNDGLPVGVGIGDWWVRPDPGAPLLRMTNGQATDAFIAEGISEGPFNYAHVRSVPGSWFPAAFQDDLTVHGYNVNAHPWIPSAPPTTPPPPDHDAAVIVLAVVLVVVGVALVAAAMIDPPAKPVQLGTGIAQLVGGIIAFILGIRTGRGRRPRSA